MLKHDQGTINYELSASWIILIKALVLHTLDGIPSLYSHY